MELGVGGEVIAQVFQQTRRFGIFMRFDEKYRKDIEAIGNIRVRTPEGALIPISDLAGISEVIGPIQINLERNQRRIVIQANVEGRDLGSVVEEIQAIVKERIALKPGYFIEYGGQFENQRQSMARLAIIVPITMFFIFILPYSAFNSFRQAFLIYLNIPFALIGVSSAFWLRGNTFQFRRLSASLPFSVWRC